jgi:hypothetical protein
MLQWLMASGLLLRRGRNEDCSVLAAFCRTLLSEYLLAAGGSSVIFFDLAKKGACCMLKSKSLSILAGATALVLCGTAQATVVFTPGNNPQPDEENIMFETAQTGLTITGDTNQSNTPVLFTSTQSLTTTGMGQAELTPTVGSTITGTVTFSVPGDSFTD